MLNLSIGSGKALLRRAQLRKDLKELVDPTRYLGEKHPGTITEQRL